MPTVQIHDFLDFGGRSTNNGVLFSKYKNEGLATGVRKTNSNTQRSFFKCNLSSLPAKIIITKATLYIYCSLADASGGLTEDYRKLAIHKITANWSFNTLENEPAYAAVALKTEDVYYGGQEWHSLEITDHVKKIYSGTEQNNGWLLKTIKDDQPVNYNSVLYFISPLNTEEPTMRPYLEVEYIDTVPPAPIPTDPIGLYKDRANIIRFGWNATGMQTKFNLYWSSNNGSTWNKVSQTSSNKYYDMPANTLPTGQISWKVTIFNDYNEESADSTINVFTAMGVPATPTITGITNIETPRPTITWTSSDQQIYQIQILQNEDIIYDTGNIPSITIKSHTITVSLEEGIYTAKVRVKNEFDLYSSWANADFTISTPRPDKPPITLSLNKYSINVLSDIADNSYLLLYRAEINSNDFKCIAKATANSLEDYTVESDKEYKYKVRAVNSTGAFTDSDIKTTTSAKIEMSTLSPVSDLSNIFEVKYNLNSRPAKNITISTPSTTNYFSGRQYPVVEYSEHLNCGISLSFFIKDDVEYQQLLDVIYRKGIVLYRDGRRKLYGNIGGINVTDHFAGYVVNLSISQTDFDEYLEV